MPYEVVLHANVTALHCLDSDHAGATRHRKIARDGSTRAARAILPTRDRQSHDRLLCLRLLGQRPCFFRAAEQRGTPETPVNIPRSRQPPPPRTQAGQGTTEAPVIVFLPPYTPPAVLRARHMAATLHPCPSDEGHDDESMGGVLPH